MEKHIKARGISDQRVIEAMLKVERHLFVPDALRDRAYEDRPLPIGEGQTISQPYVVALMTEAVALRGGEVVLEVGTGSGYQAAILGEIVKEVYTIEINERLCTSARQRLEKLGYKNIFVRCGDGYKGWPEAAPFDAIVVTAAADHVPRPLLEQLKEGGRLIMPLGDPHLGQVLTLIRKDKGKFVSKEITGVRFVPMTGEAEKGKK